VLWRGQVGAARRGAARQGAAVTSPRGGCSRCCCTLPSGSPRPTSPGSPSAAAPWRHGPEPPQPRAPAGRHLHHQPEAGARHPARCRPFWCTRHRGLGWSPGAVAPAKKNSQRGARPSTGRRQSPQDPTLDGTRRDAGSLLALPAHWDRLGTLQSPTQAASAPRRSQARDALGAGDGLITGSSAERLCYFQAVSQAARAGRESGLSKQGSGDTAAGTGRCTGQTPPRQLLAP